MTLHEFTPIFALLAMQLRATDADEATIRAYYAALRDVAPELLAMAAKRFSVQPTDGDHAWFPKTAEWRSMAFKIQCEREDELAARLRKLPAPLCLACEDTGWELGENHRVKPCACRSLRRLEVLGVRPMPALPEQMDDPGAAELLMKVASAATALASTRGMR